MKQIGQRANLDWVKISLVIVVLLSSAVVGFLPDSLRIFVIAAGAGLLAILLLGREPGIGFALLIVTSQVIPWGLGTGTNSSVNVSMLLVIGLAGIWVLKIILGLEKFELLPSKTIPPIIIFTFIVLLALLNGQIHWFSVSPAPIRAQIGGAALFLLSFFAFLVLAHQLKNFFWLKVMVWLLIAFCLIYMIGFHFIAERVDAVQTLILTLYTRGATGSVMWVWVASLAFAQAVFNNKLRPFWRIFLLAFIGLLLYVRITLAAGWTSGWLPPVLSLVVILVLGLPRMILVWITGALLGIAVSIQKLIDFILKDNEYSVGTRLAAWEILFKIIKVNPILGVGPANYYWYTPLFNIMGYYLQFNSHNNYIDIAAQTGIFGVICFFWFFGAATWVAWQLKNKVPEGFYYAYVLGCLGGIAGTLLAGFFGDWVIPFTYNVGFTGFRSSMLVWIFVGALVAIENAVKQNRLDLLK